MTLFGLGNASYLGVALFDACEAGSLPSTAAIGVGQKKIDCIHDTGYRLPDLTKRNRPLSAVGAQVIAYAGS